MTTSTSTPPSAATDFILIRHGETDWNRELRFQGHIDIPLNDTGHEQARRLGLRLAGEPVDLFFCSDLLRAQQQAISIPNIQKTVADYYGLQIKDLLSKRRTRSLARPRQVAMALTKELTEHSLPEIGDAFAGRDHTTVLHACRQIRTLMEADGKLREDWDKLIRKLSE